jgi:transposase-like protein
MSQRKHFTAELKARVARGAIKIQKTIQEIAHDNDTVRAQVCPT